jgi:uncharacterized protein (TIGR02569 family)
VAPPPAVVAAFGADAAALPLSGIAWRAGDIVFKPLDMDERALAWQADVLAGVVPDGFRVAPPLRSGTGALVVDGWTAWPWLAGAHAPRWLDIAAVGERFHRALAGVERPAELLDARTDPWAVADRIAWGELDAAAPGPLLRALLAARRPVNAPAQLVHGDLSGNVLFATGLPPAVIDLSPYWRPPAYAAALVRVDAVLWHGASLGLLARQAGQLVLRALLFRLLVEADAEAAASSARELVEYALRVAARSAGGAV